jgi:uncharacterized membrane protein YczE
MKKKMTFYTEAAYLVGIIGIAVGVGFMERADFGLSMVVAPAYVLHRYLSTLPGMGFFSFGVAEYTLQAVLIILLAVVVRKFRLSYLFSFVTAVVYGYVLDLILMIMPTVAADAIAVRLAFFVIGEIFCAIGVSMMFRTYISPEAYELFVAQVSARFGVKTERFKTGYDIVSCTVGIGLSFLFFGFGNFVGIGWGTAVCALTNGFIIGWFGKLWDALFEFKDGLKLRKLFEK